MSSIAGKLERPVFRPLGGLFLSILFHGTLAVIFIGWFTSTIPKTGVLPPAISLQLGVYQLEQHAEPEVNHAPKQQRVTREESLPEVVEKIDKLPQTAIVDNGTLTKVSEKKQPLKKKLPQEKKIIEDAVVATQESAVTSVPASGSASNNSANFSSNASAAVSGQQGWHSEVHQRLSKAKRYPRAALRFRSTGVSQVKVVVDNKGVVVNASLVTSSGTKILDKEALATIARAAPFPVPPETLLIDGKVEFVAPITFDTTAI
ncbi:MULTISPECIES: energy transducer TonB family protein [Providencia]|uniref:Ferric siderophore transport system periplasmic binding protein n=1 Tax=Providencia heimbachae ATCC 35613 TaxID=1354272 RepID=A0A1B7JQL5_9GAMM|nr:MULTISPECIES: energy transducer TonB [Providencia]MBP6122172.1 energy transducer TonB [Providencia sp.]NIH21339.1 energy transducer TonB [Providencia heimbachae]OAT50190.1 ferric siderophore transport system periplasmic binding protein [Providencia heimbachae ATCC 35613]QCJ68937.1 energy transducer TonB [Providencia heimbachae]SQH11972.1 transport protein TonB [Providencia heimbachae]